MDLQTGLLCGAVVVCAVAVVVLVSLFGTSGKTYEEAVAEQRKAAGELLALAGNKPKHTTSKKNKKLGRKAKDKKSSGVSEAESEAPADSGVEEETSVPHKGHVEFVEEPTIEAPIEKPTKIRKRGKDLKMKPILLNKEDPSCVSDLSVPPSPTGSVANHFEEIHPKDEFELLHSSISVEKNVSPVVGKKEAKPAKGGKGQKAVAVKQELPKEEVPAPPKTIQDSPKEQRKGKRAEKKQAVEAPVVKEEQVSVAVPQAVASVQPASLTTEKLLKQAYRLENVAPIAAPTGNTAGAGKAAKKNKKNEAITLAGLISSSADGININELVRLVNAAELSRSEIQLLTDCLLNKQHGPLPQHSEWSEGPNDPVQKMKKQLSEKEKALQEEQEASQALHAKLKELRTLLNSERSRASAAARAAEEAGAGARSELLTLQARLQRLADEHQALTVQNHQLQTKLNAEAEATAQRVQMEMHIQRLSETESALVAQLGALQVEANARAVEASQAVCESARFQQQAGELAQQVEESNRVCAELEVQRQNAIRAEQLAQQELRQANERLTAISELQSEVQRLNAKLQQEELKTAQAQEQAELQKQQLITELTQVKQDLAASQAKQQGLNGVPNDAQKKVELLNLDNALEKLRSELASARQSNVDHHKQISSLQQQLDHYKNKNNELRTKNWKVMEAFQNAEKALQQKQKPAQPSSSSDEAIADACEQQFRETREALQAVLPSLAAGDAQSPRAWLTHAASHIQATIRAEQEASKVAQPVDDSRVAQLQEQNAHLQTVFDNNKKMLAETEGLLSRLQQNVALEEERWAQQLSEKQQELDDLRQQSSKQEPLAFAYSCIEKSLPAIMTEMQSRIDALQEELARERQHRSSHNQTQTLADMERMTEENARLTGLVDKHPIEMFNGPLELTPNTPKARKLRRSLTGWFRRKITFRRKKSKHKAENDVLVIRGDVDYSTDSQRTNVVNESNIKFKFCPTTNKTL